jgi:hypothetical protein
MPRAGFRLLFVALVILQCLLCSLHIVHRRAHAFTCVGAIWHIVRKSLEWNTVVGRHCVSRVRVWSALSCHE